MNLYKQNKERELILASASPRRKDLIEASGIKVSVIPSGVSEDNVKSLEPRDIVTELALRKANFLSENNTKAWVIGADTVVAIDGQVLGKPDNADHAKEMLSMLQGKSHEVIGGVALCCKELGREVSESFVTEVSFTAMSEAMIDSYVSTKEPYDKAGSYAIQGLAMNFVDSIRGSYTNVVGLDVTGFVRMLFSEGILVND